LSGFVFGNQHAEVGILGWLERSVTPQLPSKDIGRFPKPRNGFHTHPIALFSTVVQATPQPLLQRRDHLFGLDGSVACFHWLRNSWSWGPAEFLFTAQPPTSNLHAQGSVEETFYPRPVTLNYFRTTRCFSFPAAKIIAYQATLARNYSFKYKQHRNYHAERTLEACFRLRGFSSNK
jgi:hypothetical protein